MTKSRGCVLRLAGVNRVPGLPTPVVAAVNSTVNTRSATELRARFTIAGASVGVVGEVDTGVGGTRGPGPLGPEDRPGVAPEEDPSARRRARQPLYSFMHFWIPSFHHRARPWTASATASLIRG